MRRIGASKIQSTGRKTSYSMAAQRAKTVHTQQHQDEALDDPKKVIYKTADFDALNPKKGKKMKKNNSFMLKFDYEEIEVIGSRIRNKNLFASHILPSNNSFVETSRKTGDVNQKVRRKTGSGILKVSNSPEEAKEHVGAENMLVKSEILVNSAVGENGEKLAGGEAETEEGGKGLEKARSPSSRALSKGGELSEMEIEKVYKS